MYNSAYKIFQNALKREGKVITSYSDNTPYTVIFKRNSDTNQLQDKITIFYPTGCGIHAGQLLTYNNKHFLTLNQETAENDVYNKSDLFETNSLMTIFESNKQTLLPVYCYDVQDALFESNNIISVESGNFEMITEINDISKAFNIATDFYAMGNYWKINQIISKNSIYYIYSKVESIPASNTLTVTVSGSGTSDIYYSGQKSQFTAVAKWGEMQINNADLIWSTSNSSLATVDNNGSVTFLAEGNVNIIATWKSQNITSYKNVTISKPINATLTITGNDTYTTADTPTLTATAYKDGVVDSTATITWVSSDSTIATINSTGIITFLKAGSVTFTATWVQYNVTQTKVITVTQAQTMTCTISYKTSSEIKAGGSAKPYTAHFWIGTTELTDQTAAWTVTPPTGYESYITTTINPNGVVNTISIAAGNKSTMIGQYVNLKLEDSNHTCSATLAIKIISLL
ncbi:Ig-like domain-containing protein [Caproiciproducens sp.]